MYKNDYLNGLSCDAVMFADNVKIWRTIESPTDVQRLQNDINQLSILSQGALMSFNADKCVALRLHPQQAKNNNSHNQLNGQVLGCVSHRRDLDVIVDETLKPNRQCAKAAKNANLLMRAIKASLTDITPALFHNLYGAFIRPHLVSVLLVKGCSSSVGLC